MPLPEGVRPEPDRPFITVRTATSHHDPDEIRRYATREECLADLHRWQEASLVRQDPYYHLGIGYQGDDSTYTFEVYETGELRLQLDIDRKGHHETGAWAAAPDTVQVAGQASRILPDATSSAAKQAATSWMNQQRKTSPAGGLLDYILDPDEIAPQDGRNIIETFKDMCERAIAQPGTILPNDYERILRRAIEQHLQTMEYTPERTWAKIKDDYSTLFDAAEGNPNRLPYQDGFREHHELVKKALDTGHYPDGAETRLQALRDSLDSCVDRTESVAALSRAAHRACLHLDKLQEWVNYNRGRSIEDAPEFVRWLTHERDATIMKWNAVSADADLKQHLPLLLERLLPDLLERMERLADPAIPTLFDPRLAPARDVNHHDRNMQGVARLYARALESVDRNANLLPYSLHFDELTKTMSEAIVECANNPVQAGQLHTLSAQLSVSGDRMLSAKSAAQDLTDTCTGALELERWARSNRQPIQEAPDFNTWRDKADDIVRRCTTLRTSYRMAPHFERTGVSDDSVSTAFALLQDSRFQRPPSPEQIAAQRQARAETHRESASMSM